MSSIYYLQLIFAYSLLGFSASLELEQGIVALQTVTLQDPVSGVAIADIPFPVTALDDLAQFPAFIRPSSTPSPSIRPSPSPTPSSSQSSSPSTGPSPTSSPSVSPSRSPSPSPSQPASSGDSGPSSGGGSSSSDATSNPSPPAFADSGSSSGGESSDADTTSEPGTTVPADSGSSSGADSSDTDTSSDSSTTVPEDSTPSTSSEQTSCFSTCTCDSLGELSGDESFDEQELERFGSGASSIYLAADWDSGFARSNWDAALATHDGSVLSLKVEKRQDGLWGSEIRTNSKYYGYGCVSACMKPIGTSGVISSLFSYTGPYDGISGTTQNQNEIDIEFEGVNTNIVQFNYYTDRASTDPKQNNEHDHTLSFNPSESFNVYGFRWTPSGIDWEVNGEVVHTVNDTASVPPPKVTEMTVQKIMANAWVVTEATAPYFGGEFDEASFTSTSAQYRWIRYEKLSSDGCCTISATCLET